MGSLKKILLGGAAVLTLSLGLTGCGAWNYDRVEPTVDSPLTAESSGLDLFYTELPEQDITVGCLEDGYSKSHVLSCFPVGEDIPAEELVDFDSLGYSVSYVDVGQGQTVLCMEDGYSKSRVLTCVPVTAKPTPTPR